MAEEMNTRTGFCQYTWFTTCFCCDGLQGDFERCMQWTSYLCWLEEWFFFWCMDNWGIDGLIFKDHIEYQNLYFTISSKKNYRCSLQQGVFGHVCHTQRGYTFQKADLGWWFNWEDAESMPHLVMHDNTDIWLMCPTNPWCQWVLYSWYYAGCIAKGGVAIQPCGWIATWELCTGGIDDSRYVKMVKIFEKQQQYAQYDDETDHRPFTNIFDRGYRVVLDGVKCGKQICIQPVFTDSEKKFTTNEVLYLAAIAALRSGNEPAVRQVKSSWWLKRGCTFQSWDFSMLSDIWLVWGFQINFMYSAVH